MKRFTAFCNACNLSAGTLHHCLPCSQLRIYLAEHSRL